MGDADNSQITMEEFRHSRATATASKAGGKTSSSVGKYSLTDLSNKMNLSRPSTASGKTTEIEQDKNGVKSLEGRIERAKLLRDKQAEERKKKYEERKAAVEDRRRLKERQESAKNEAMRNLLEHKSGPGSRNAGKGRKLPNLPGDSTKDIGCSRRETVASRRVSSGSSSSDSPVHTPPGSSSGAKSSRRNLTGPTSASTSCLSNVGNGRVQSRSTLGVSKRASSSTSNLTDKPLGNDKPAKVKEKLAVPRTHKVPTSRLPKAQSTGAIHQLGHGTSRPASGKKPKSKSGTVHHAGTSNEQEAKLALAEHRRKVREEAERQALLDKEKQEQLQKQREEEEKRLAEENAKEAARQAELTKVLKEQEEERARLLREQREKEETERAAAEAKRKEEIELMRKQELERRAKEAEKREKEEEERLRREEAERQERRKRVEMIMSRTRMTAASNNNNTKGLYSSQEDLSKALDDPRYHSATVSEILQKVKEKSRGSPNPEQDLAKQMENQNLFKTAESELRDSKNDNTTAVNQTRNGTNKLDSFVAESGAEDVKSHEDTLNYVPLSLKQDNKVTDRAEVDGEVVGNKTNFINGNSKSSPSGEEGRPDGELWKNVEDVMQSSESHARDNLERNGAIAEDEDDEDGEEGQLWKVVEGKREISEVV